MSTATTSDAPVSTGSALDRFFKISERGSTVGREVRGGFVTFFTMAYIVALNPLILGFVKDGTGAYLGGGSGDGSNLPAIAAGTALVAGIMTILMGAVANYPLALATGLGLNAFVAVSIATQMTWADAMGLVVLEGLLILVLVLTGFRQAVFHAVPTQLKTAISVGIGLFIALIGFVDAGFVTRIPDAAHTTVPVQLGKAAGPGRLARARLRHRPRPGRHPRGSARSRAPSSSRIVASTLVAMVVQEVADLGPDERHTAGRSPSRSGRARSSKCPTSTPSGSTSSTRGRGSASWRSSSPSSPSCSPTSSTRWAR